MSGCLHPPTPPPPLPCLSCLAKWSMPAPQTRDITKQWSICPGKICIRTPLWCSCFTLVRFPSAVCFSSRAQPPGKYQLSFMEFCPRRVHKSSQIHLRYCQKRNFHSIQKKSWQGFSPGSYLVFQDIIYEDKMDFPRTPKQHNTICQKNQDSTPGPTID